MIGNFSPVSLLGFEAVGARGVRGAQNMWTSVADTGQVVRGQLCTSFTFTMGRRCYLQAFL